MDTAAITGPCDGDLFLWSEAMGVFGFGRRGSRRASTTVVARTSQLPGRIYQSVAAPDMSCWKSDLIHPERERPWRLVALERCGRPYYLMLRAMSGHGPMISTCLLTGQRMMLEYAPMLAVNSQSLGTWCLVRIVTGVKLVAPVVQKQGDDMAATTVLTPALTKPGLVYEVLAFPDISSAPMNAMMPDLGARPPLQSLVLMRHRREFVLEFRPSERPVRQADGPGWLLYATTTGASGKIPITLRYEPTADDKLWPVQIITLAAPQPSY